MRLIVVRSALIVAVYIVVLVVKRHGRRALHQHSSAPSALHIPYPQSDAQHLNRRDTARAQSLPLVCTMASYGHSKPKSRAATKVKPILRKLTQSEHNSLDLDRSAYEQDGLGISDGYGVNMTAPRTSHDVAGRRGYHHRSTSNTSQFSATTTGSGHRAGSFVHPFAQTPRPYTPPLAVPNYQTSIRESLDHSPALTEDEAFEPLRSPQGFRSTSNLSNHTSPSITNHPTTSSPSLNQPQPLRLQTKTHSTSSSRLALATSHSPDPTSPADTIPTSALRTSIDAATSTFRLRSRSEGLETRTNSYTRTPTNTETIHEARRKFAEKESLKEEKAARDEVKALERRQMREARALEKGHRRSSASERPAARGKPRSRSDLTKEGMREELQEKDGLVGRGYGEVVPMRTPTFAPGEMEPPRRTGTAKLKTHSAWTKFVMWIRTRFIRMGKEKGS